MPDKKTIYSQKASNAGSVGLPSNRAPGFTDLIISIFCGGFVDDVENPTDTSIKSGKTSDLINLPYPEARWWGKNLGNKVFNEGVVVALLRADTTLHTADTTALTADYF